MIHLLLLLVGCAKPAITQVNAWESVPRLPAPAASTYNRSPETPPDPPVAQLAAKHRWDAALAGAAAGLALELMNEREPVLTRWRVREALWRAGYPYPAQDARAWKALADGAPPPDLLRWLGEVDPSDDLGLVRARGHQEDLWVGLRARPRVALGPIPRQVATGASFTLPAAPGSTYVVADANGALQRGSLEAPVRIEVGSPGEWMVRIDTDAGPVGTFPVYVGIVPPTTKLLAEAAPLRTPHDALGRIEGLLTGIRGVYGARPLARDFMLDAGARSLLRGDAGSPDGVVQSLGLDPAHTAVWRCAGTTVEACLDGMIWEPENRLALLDDASSLGLAADLDERGVNLVGIVSRTR